MWAAAAVWCTALLRRVRNNGPLPWPNGQRSQTLLAASCKEASMNTPESLSDMVSDLIRRGLPVDYSERAAAEFTDHYRDLVEELQASGWSESQASVEASQRLGDPRTLAKKTVREYQRRYLCARWPLITFIVAPIPTILAAWLATGYSILGVIKVLGLLGCA